MKKCVIIPDSYKGTLSAIRVCDIMKKAVKNHFPDCEVCAIPIADGGEGTVDCFLYAMKGQKIEVETTGPYGEPVQAYYARIDNTAVIETASVAGLSMVEGRMAPRKTTTFGMGKLIRHAVENGCRKIIIGLGGSPNVRITSGLWILERINTRRKVMTNTATGGEFIYSRPPQRSLHRKSIPITKAAGALRPTTTM